MANLVYIIYMLVGTYTGGGSEGVYAYKFNTHTGESEYVGMAEVANPSYLTVSGDGKYVYAVTENGGEPSFANALGFDKTSGRLALLDTEQTNGGAPCNIVADCNGRHVVTANYTGGSITVFETEADGSLSPAKQVIKFEGNGPDPRRQEQPHLHCVKFSPDGKYLFAADLGTDKIYRFEADYSGSGDFLREETLTSFAVPAGSGPRHFIFHPDGKHFYLINELSGAVIVFDYDNGELTPKQTLQADTVGGRSSADIVITPDGKYLYASNRARNDGVAIFSVEPSTGLLTKVGYQNTGRHPRNLSITPNGKFLLSANRNSNAIEVYEIDYSTGLLNNTGKNIELADPVCVVFVE